jgi:hypothetical protein
MQATPNVYDILMREGADIYDQEGNVLLKVSKAAIVPDMLGAANKAVESHRRAPTLSLRSACVRAPA